MKKTGIKIFCLFILLLSLLLFGGCTGVREIDQLGIVTAIGIDKSEEGYLISYQVINPKSLSKSNTIPQSPIQVYSESGKDLFETTRDVISHSSRKIYFSHLKLVVFGEDIAKDGIKDILDFFIREHEFRTDFYFSVANGITANNLIKILTPLESISGIEMYSSLEVGQSAWAPVKKVSVIELIGNVIYKVRDPVLPGICVVDESDQSDSIDILSLSSGTKLKFKDLCVFSGDKMVGWLCRDDGKAFNYIIDNIENTVGSFDYDERTKISVEIVDAHSDIKAEMKDDKPVINISMDIKYNIGLILGELDVLNKEIEEKINKGVEDRITQISESVIKKCQDEYKADIFGFGEAIHRAYPKYWKEVKDNWRAEFEKLHININVKAKLDALGEITR